MHWLSLSVVSGGCSSMHYVSFSLPCLLLLQSMGSRCLGVSSAACRLSTVVLSSMWNLSGPGIEPMSPALAGKFLSTVPPGKSPP